MARISELIEATAKATELDQDLVSLYARRLTDAGILPKSSGRRYAQASPEHAAALLIALWATDRPTEGAAMVRALTAPGYLPEELRVSQGALDRLTQLLEATKDLDLEIWKKLHADCRINFSINPIGGMYIDWGSGPKEYFLVLDPDVEKMTELHVESWMRGVVICRIGAFLAGKDYVDIFSQIRDDISSQRNDRLNQQPRVSEAS